VALSPPEAFGALMKSDTERYGKYLENVAAK
jgi:hypothetical protein